MSNRVPRMYSLPPTEPQASNMENSSEERHSQFTCRICIERVRVDDKIKKCKHGFCSNCMAKYIEAKVVEFNVANIKCPAVGCNLLLDPLSCRPFISKHIFNKWCDLLCNATVLHDYSNKFVYCPYRDCSALILNECGGGDEQERCTCPYCKKKFCVRCKSPWHAGYWCREMKKFKDRNDILVGRLIEKEKWTRCPKCGNAVERRGGCPTIHCRCIYDLPLIPLFALSFGL
ncbi:hypothetical protein PTKIN_Ptkin05aG0185100 [Pterospermum kingtungense]